MPTRNRDGKSKAITVIFGVYSKLHLLPLTLDEAKLYMEEEKDPRIPYMWPRGVMHGFVICPEGTAKLDAALCRAKEEFVPIKTDTDNPFYKNKFASLAALLEATTLTLAKQGLVVKHHYTDQVLFTRLSHTSGEWECSTYTLPNFKNDSQGLGSAISYAKRYAYMAILGLAADKDDDGAGAMPAETSNKPLATHPTANRSVRIPQPHRS